MPATDEMETAGASSSAGQPKVKRIKLSADGKELGAGGRPTLPGMDEDRKVALHAVVCVMHQRVSTEIFGVTPEQAARDVLVGVYVMNQVWSVHNYYRSKGNDNKSQVVAHFETGADSFEITVHGTAVTVSKKALMAIYEETLATAGFDAKAKDKSAWMGTLHTIMALYNLFGERLNEMRVMPATNTIKVLKGESKTQEKELKVYGIQPGLRHFAQGSDYKPVMKSALAQSLGPATALVQLSEAQDNKYSQKWVDATRRAFQHVPHIEEIAEFMKKNRPQDLVKINQYLMAIASFTGTREQKRICFPPGLLAYLFVQKDKTGTFQFFADKIKALDFSGTGAYRIYKLMTALQVGPKKEPFKFDLNVADANESKQILFHTMMGTSGEDFGVLEFMTDVKGWKKRKEIKEAFVTMKISHEKLKQSAFTPIGIKRYAKVASGLLTDNLSGGSAPITNCMILAGNRKRLITSQMRTLCETGAVGSLGKVDAGTIERSLSDFLNAVKKHWAGDTYKAGTVKWRDMSGLTSTAEGAILEDVPEETGQLYWSN
ncbi:hypothetical protein [Araguari virus]|uniref:Nucleoprotein n=1 Tax=Araguari virus TaxID=352236 RepID=A0A343FNE4_9ORTO|nr:hypothetical protein QK767_s4gp1 [Araguari virus]ASR92127.1 hypothetical protein [Araguari virus]